jgi:hypothetical protein
MSHDQRDRSHCDIPQKFEGIFVVFRLMKNIIFKKTKSFIVTMPVKYFAPKVTEIMYH